jgi:pumilio family protein 6
MAGDLATDKQGRKVLLYLLTPRSSRHFIPSTVAQLKQVDEAAAKTSKKDKDIRRKELKDVISPDLIKLVEDQGEQLLRETGSSLLVAEILLSAVGGKSADVVLQTCPHHLVQ